MKIMDRNSATTMISLNVTQEEEENFEAKMKTFMMYKIGKLILCVLRPVHTHFGNSNGNPNIFLSKMGYIGSYGSVHM